MASKARDDQLSCSNVDFGLDFVNEVVRESLSNNNLIVLAKGLGTHKVAAALLYCIDAAGTNRYGDKAAPFDKESLVLVVNARARDVSLIDGELSRLKSLQQSIIRGITEVNYDTPAIKRQELYAKGGVFAVRSRILTVDMITSTINVKKIAGIVVLNAHTVGESSKEAFIIRLLRSTNQEAFIKAISDEPNRISRGINGLPNRLTNLGVQQVSLWPRFRFEVSNCLGTRQLQEIILEMDARTVDTQGFLQDIIQSCISQIKRNVKDIDTESWNIDAVQSSDLHRLIRLQLDSVYHKIGKEARQAIADLDQLQHLLHILSNAHPCDWHIQLEAIKLARSQGTMPSLWLTLPAADAMSQVSLERVQNGDVPAKWIVLLDLLKELKGRRVLVMCASGFTQTRLMQLVALGDGLSQQLYLRLKASVQSMKSASRILEGNDAKVPTPPPSEGVSPGGNKAPPNKRRRVRGGANPPQAVHDSGAAESPSASLMSLDVDPHLFFDGYPVNAVRRQDGEPIFSGISEPLAGTASSDLPGEILICTYDVVEVLEKYRPEYVIMYEPNLQFTRDLEIYQSTFGPLQQVYFLYYQRSIEELIYLTNLRKEKDVFSALIREKGNMPMTIDDFQFHRKGEGELRVVNTRLAGGQTRTEVFNETEKVVVDAREFMSDLPYLIWKQNIDLIPLQLEVGDYILTPDCVVERKSIPDLLSSFKDGRLYEQCVKMFKHYKQPVLLIEFSGDKAFSFDQFRDFNKAAASIVYEKLAVILLLFPKLKVIWSQSQLHTSEIFQKIKYSQKQPDPQHCIEVGKKVIVNSAAMDVLRAIPGVSAQTAPLIAENLTCLADLAEMSQRDLALIVGPESARSIVEFMDHKL